MIQNKHKMLQSLGLNVNNSIIIGSGILEALGIRESKDIDVVTTFEVYDRLKDLDRFTTSVNNGRHILVDNLFEIAVDWFVFGKSYKLEDLIPESIIIDEVRYLTLDFMYKVKQSWVKEKNPRQKDIADLALIEDFRNRKN